ncbi:MAG: TetR/AcrR family transcriptional regulator [Pseudomonadota bacterium]
MPKTKSASREALVDNAMRTFWKNGYHVVSMGDLVRETGVSRGGIYTDFPGKQELFHACLDRYQETVITSLFAPVETGEEGIEGIRKYLDELLSHFRADAGFGIGCLVGNTTGQIDPSEVGTLRKLQEHFARLKKGFVRALSQESDRGGRLTKAEIDELASFAMISVQGMWSYSRSTTDADVLQKFSNDLITYLEERCRPSRQPS